MRSDSQPGRSDSVPKIGDVLDDVDTPALIVELDALERNVAAMAAAVEDRGVRLRPHAKSHKSPDIARRQLAAGAVGICCQKVGEAEAFVAAGVTDVLITNEIVGAAKLARLALLSRNARLGVLVDDRVNVGSLAAAMRAAGASFAAIASMTAPCSALTWRAKSTRVASFARVTIVAPRRNWPMYSSTSRK